MNRLFGATASEVVVLREQLAEAREEIRQLKAELRPKVVIPVEWGLSASHVKIFFALLGAKTPLSKASIIAVTRGVPGAWAGDDVCDKVADVQICKMRKRLKPFGIVIDTLWAQGYWLKNRNYWLARLSPTIPSLDRPIESADGGRQEARHGESRPEEATARGEEGRRPDRDAA